MFVVLCVGKRSLPVKKALSTALSRQREFHPKPLTEPYVILSHHTARAIQSNIIENRPMIKHCWIT